MPPSFARQVLGSVGATGVPSEIPVRGSQIRERAIILDFRAFLRRGRGRLARVPSVFVGSTPLICTPWHRHEVSFRSSHVLPYVYVFPLSYPPIVLHIH